MKAVVFLLMLLLSEPSNSMENFGAEEFTLWNRIVTKDFFQSISGPGER